MSRIGPWWVYISWWFPAWSTNSDGARKCEGKTRRNRYYSRLKVCTIFVADTNTHGEKRGNDMEDVDCRLIRNETEQSAMIFRISSFIIVTSYYVDHYVNVLGNGKRFENNSQVTHLRDNKSYRKYFSILNLFLAGARVFSRSSLCLLHLSPDKLSNYTQLRVVHE